MPKLDGTGPTGQGAKSGQGMGNCGGLARNMAWGCRFGSRSRKLISPKNELAALEQEEALLTEELEAVRKEKASLKDQTK